MIARYWAVHAAEDGAGHAVAGDPDLAAELEDVLFEQAWLRDWEEPVLELVDGNLTDYLASDLPLRVCSMRLRGIVDAARTIGDRYQWLPVTVVVGGREVSYTALHLLRAPLWLDYGCSKWEDGLLVEPVVNRERAGGRKVLGLPDDPDLWIVAHDLHLEMEDASITGVEFEEVQVE